MSDFTIKCNNVPRNLRYGNEMPKKLRSDFDYIDDEEFDLHDFVEYKGCWYDVSEFVRVPEDSEHLKGWHGYQADGAFSGVLIKLLDGDKVLMATYFC